MIDKKKQESDNHGDFEKEMLPHFKLLYNYAIKMTGNSDDAKDLVQETFMKAFRFYDSYEKGTNSKAWLFRILKNSFINNYRKTANEPQKVIYDEVENFLDNIKDGSLESTNLERTIFDNKLGDEVTTALNSLPKEFRDVIILCDMEGWTYEEIAKYMNCPVGTVRSRIHRGRKMLEIELKSYAEEYGYV
jgi:RNA polymerase sigma-70 factor, ECF subfamily